MRFARAWSDDSLKDLRRYSTKEFDDFSSVLQTYLRELHGEGSCAGIAIAAAGPVDDGCVQLTNLPWVIRREDVLGAINAVLGVEIAREKVVLLNDLAAVASGLPYLTNKDFELLGQFEIAKSASAPMLAINVGTGFGAASVIPLGESWCVASSEAGHMTFVAADGEDSVYHLNGRSIESFLSGTGVIDAYERLSGEQGADRGQMNAGDVFDRVNSDSNARAVVDLFGRVLGRVCGNLILATGSWGGVFLTGSVAQSWVQVGSVSDFRNTFEAKGQMRERMKGTPSYLITIAEPALVGMARSIGNLKLTQ